MSEPDAPLENLVLDFSAKDPVCGMIVEPPQARGKARYHGDLYFFCSPGCMQQFMASPAKYLAPPAESGTPAPPLPAPKKPDKVPVCGRTVDPSTAYPPRSTTASSIISALVAASRGFAAIPGNISSPLPSP